MNRAKKEQLGRVRLIESDDTEKIERAVLKPPVRAKLKKRAYIRPAGPYRIKQSFVKQLKLTDEGQQLFYDSDLSGFGLLVGKNTKSYFAEHLIRGSGGKKRRIKIGRDGLLTAYQARERAKRLILRMSDGDDPREEQLRQVEAARKAEAEQITLKQLCKEFCSDRESRLKANTLLEYRRFIESDFRSYKLDSWEE